MNAGTYNLCINQNATFSKTLIWTTKRCCGCGTVGVSSGPVDLTGYTAQMQIRPFYNGPVLYDVTPDITLGGVDGTIQIEISAADTETFIWWKGVYDLRLTDSSGIVTRLLAGSVDVSPAVTQ